MNVVVIGGTRFIGPAVVRTLRADGHDVLLFHRGATETEEIPADVAHLHGDRSRLPDFTAAFDRFQPDVVLDMIALTEADARITVELFRGLARRTVVLSSADVYRAYDVLRGKTDAAPDAVPLSEEASLREKLHPYETDYDKILVERVFTGCPDLPCTVLRLPIVYGPGDYQRRTRPYLKRMQDGRHTILLEEGLATWRITRAYVDDVAAAVALAVADQRAAGRTYNLGDLEPWSEQEWIRAIGAAAGWNHDVVTLPAGELPAHLVSGLNCGQELVVDTGRIRRELGYAEPTPRWQAVAHTVAWEQVHPPADVDDDAQNFDYAAEDLALLRHRGTADGF